MKLSNIAAIVVMLAASLFAQAGSKAIGKVTYIEGQAFLERNGKKSQKLSVSMKIQAGDVLGTGVESILEITLGNGTVLRFAENARGTVDEKTGNGNVKMQSGKLWANVQKIQNGSFSVGTPVATAAVRGTIFRVETDSSSGSTVALYEGIVDVGPADSTKVKPPKTSEWGPPVEVAGPYEVTLEEWVRLRPGMQIHVQGNGKYATGMVDDKSDAASQWIRFNQKRDQSVARP